MNYEQTTGRTIQQDFEAFHQKHPEVFNWFKRYARQYIKAQQQKGIHDEDIRISSKLIINRIRWEIHMKGGLNPSHSAGDSELNATLAVWDEFKINDAFTSRYARLFIETLPKGSPFANAFNLRVLRAN